MFDSSSYVDPTSLAHADTSRDVLPRGAFRCRKVPVRSNVRRHLDDCLPGAAVPATLFAGIASKNHWKGCTTDSATPSLKGHCSSFSFACGCPATSFTFVQRRKASEEDPRQLPNQVFKPPGWASFTPPIISDCCQVIYSQFGLAIHQNDHQAKRRFVEWAQNENAVVPDFHKRILFSDEAHFWLNGYVNKQNCRIWSEANPQVYVETPLHPEKLTVSCALWADGILLQKR
ncbi:hypothetical protein TNCV_2411401 [Trichonephila clavipes]|nr:hypothetical protein TNCV_2411401 [Trichonephila clavipes]